MTEQAMADRARDILESRGVKPSYQRLKILEYFLEHRNHPSVDTIYQALNCEIPTLSRTTVYNTLGLFSLKGIATALTVTDHELRYDVMESPHAHFQCTSCKSVLDIPLESDIFQTADVGGNQVREIQVTFRGLCQKCTKNQNRQGKTLDKRM